MITEPRCDNAALWITTFKDFSASSKAEQQISLPDLAERIRTTDRTRKEWLPWLKLAKFGDVRTDKNSLRHDANMLSISGIETDYDGEQIPPDVAIERLTKAGIKCLFYTSPSHTEDAPRWRVLAPTSSLLPPEKRKHLVGRINGLFDGLLANESWTCSQAYYFGTVKRNPSHRVEIINGTPIDELDELDEIWRGPADTASVPGTKIGKLDEAACLQAIADGKSYHEASMRLLGKWADAGVARQEAGQRLADAMDSVFPPDRDERWKARRADIGRCLDYVYVKEAKERDAVPPVQHKEDAGGRVSNSDGWVITSPRSLLYKPVPERRFIVDGWVAAGTVTINFGDGGVGKTLLTQQLLTSTATGKAWIGMAVERCKSIALFCEDDDDELHRRQHAINTAYGVDFDALDGLEWISGVGHDNALCNFDEDGFIQPTSAFLFFQKRAVEIGAGLIIIDTSADTFGGNENVRREVRQFMGKLLGGLAKKTGAAVILNAHPSRTGLHRDGDFDGGSTAWSNTARARWSLSRPKAEAGDDPADTNERVLTRRKANYASVGDTIKLRYQSGVLVPASVPTGLTAMVTRTQADDVFLALLAAFSAEGRPVSDNSRAGNYAPKAFGKRPDRMSFNARDFETAMHRLFAAGRIKMESYGRTSDLRHRIGVVGNV